MNKKEKFFTIKNKFHTYKVAAKKRGINILIFFIKTQRTLFGVINPLYSPSLDGLLAGQSMIEGLNKAINEAASKEESTINKNDNYNDKAKRYLFMFWISIVLFFVLFCLWGVLLFDTYSKIKEIDYISEPTQTSHIIINTVEIQIPIIVTVTVVVQPTATTTPTPSPTLWPTWTYEPTESPTETLTPTPTGTMIITEYLTVNTKDCSVNIRVAPDKGSTIIGAVKFGSVVKVLERVEGSDGNVWYKIHGGYFFNHSYPKDYFVCSCAENLVPFVGSDGDIDEE
jgi:hypothetical protein